ncbi:hypothetical protein D3C74_476760 [compost metagenome]
MLNKIKIKHQIECGNDDSNNRNADSDQAVAVQIGYGYTEQPQYKAEQIYDGDSGRGSKYPKLEFFRRSNYSCLVGKQ